MKRKQPSRKDLLSSCNEVGPDDGLDPRLYFRPRAVRKSNRKALQLCAAAARAIDCALAYELGDELLRTLRVESVVPAPDAGRLLVTVSLSVADMAIGPEPFLERLRRSTGRLRAEIATTVRRRRVPELTFHVAPRQEVGE